MVNNHNGASSTWRVLAASELERREPPAPSRHHAVVLWFPCAGCSLVPRRQSVQFFPNPPRLNTSSRRRALQRDKDCFLVEATFAVIEFASKTVLRSAVRNACLSTALIASHFKCTRPLSAAVTARVLTAPVLFSLTFLSVLEGHLRPEIRLQRAAAAPSITSNNSGSACPIRIVTTAPNDLDRRPPLQQRFRLRNCPTSNAGSPASSAQLRQDA